ncbi:MAG: DUF2490 domain-containing protein [Acidobacteria bacterium]|nr:DUF2490 domain-containing protein [Acidobacteriota bacterium]
MLIACLTFLAPPVSAQDWDQELWLDQRFSFSLSPKTFVLLRFSEKGNENISHFFETFVELNVGFHAKPWLTLIPGFFHFRFDPFHQESRFENRPLLAVLLHTRRERLRPTLRAVLEGRFPQNDPGFMRLLLRPGTEYNISTFRDRPVVFWLSNEFAFDSRSDRFSRNRFQVGISVPASERFSILPYYLIESNRLPGLWDHDNIWGLSLWWRL